MTDKVGLGFSFGAEPSFASFFVGKNAAALVRVRDSERVWLFGEPAVGKTHVLRALAREHADAVYVENVPPSLQQVEGASVLLIDAIDRFAGIEDNEYALFAAYEATDFESTRWVVSAGGIPAKVPFLYVDLASRMRLFEQVELKPVADSQRDELLRQWAQDREVPLTDEVIRFLLERIPRTQQSLWDTLQRLDRESLLQQRELTIPFVRNVLKLG